MCHQEPALDTGVLSKLFGINNNSHSVRATGLGQLPSETYEGKVGK